MGRRRRSAASEGVTSPSKVGRLDGLAISRSAGANAVILGWRHTASWIVSSLIASRSDDFSTNTICSAPSFPGSTGSGDCCWSLDEDDTDKSALSSQQAHPPSLAWSFAASASDFVSGLFALFVVDRCSRLAIMRLIDSIGMSKPLGMRSVLVDLVASRLGDDKERKNIQQVKEIGSMSTNNEDDDTLVADR